MALVPFARAAARVGGATRLAPMALVCLAVVGACSSAAPVATASVPPSAAPSAAPSLAPGSVPSSAPSAGGTPGLLLEVHSEGGFINPAAAIGALPTVVVDADGRIFTPAAPGDGATPLIPGVEVRDTGAAGAAAILAAAQAAGLADGSAGGGGVVADTGATVFTLEVDGSEVVTRVTGAGGAVGRPGLPGASDSPSGAPAAAALDLLQRLVDPTTPWGGSQAAVTTFTPSAYRLWLAPQTGATDAASVAAWPLAGDPATFGSPAAADLGVDGLRSGVVAGADARALAAALAGVGSGTSLGTPSMAFQVWIRPLLPDEVSS